jgi:opacity protein-like surface antigen
MVRVAFLLAAAAPILCLGQPLSIGLKGGVPLADSVKILDKATYTSDKAPAVFGPALEVRLPLGLGGESGLYYRRLEYANGTTRTSAQAWEIPLLAKYRAPGDHLRPFLTAGLSARWLARFKQRTIPAGSAPGSVIAEDPPELRKRWSLGPTVGGGLELGILGVRVSAELRYTRWGSASLKSALGGLATQLNQADFLLGLMF